MHGVTSPMSMRVRAHIGGEKMVSLVFRTTSNASALDCHCGTKRILSSRSDSLVSLGIKGTMEKT